MFAFIGNYFKSKENNALRKEAPVLRRAPNARFSIEYDPNLIDSLEADHVALVSLYGRIWSEGFEKQNFSKTSSLINQFKGDFQAHLLTENVKFYVYLEQTLFDDKHNLNIVKEFRTDMNDIANAAIKFCRAYQGKFSSEMIHQFKEDYAAVGEVLTRRVSLEEKSLYILYRPH